MNQQVGARRARKLTALPQEHEAIFHNSNRSLIDAASGFSLEARLPIIGVRTVSRPVEIILSNSGLLSDTLRAKLTIIGLTPFYQKEFEGEQHDLLLGGYLTILGTYATYDDMVNHGVLRSAKEYNLEIIPTFKTKEEINASFEKGKAWMIAQLGISDDPKWVHTVTMLGQSVLILLGKRLLGLSAMQWFKNRMRSLGPINGWTVMEEGINSPPVENCVAAYNAIASRHQLRKSIFEVMRGLGCMAGGEFRNVFAVICKLFHFSEMDHIYFIITYLISCNPDVLAISDLMGYEKSPLTKALTYLGTLDKSDVPYAKILQPAESTYVLSAKLFVRYTVAARAIASFYDPSVLNYKQKDNRELDALTIWKIRGLLALLMP